MAATEVIYFPFTAQLDGCPAFSADASPNSTASSSSSPPPLLNLLEGTARSASLSSADGGLGL